MKNELRELVGMEMNILELDNRMMALGFLTEADSGVFENCIQDGNIVYSEITDDLGNVEPSIQICFKVIIPASDDEIVLASVLKITSVDEF